MHSDISVEGVLQREPSVTSLFLTFESICLRVRRYQVRRYPTLSILYALLISTLTG